MQYFIQEGQNVIEVNFESPVKYADMLNSSYPYNIPTYVYSQYVKTVRNFIRKAQSGELLCQTLQHTQDYIVMSCTLFPFPDFGWDWGPAFAPVGIWRSISLVGFNVGLVTDVVPQVSYIKTGNTFLVSTLICAQVPNNGT